MAACKSVQVGSCWSNLVRTGLSGLSWFKLVNLVQSGLSWSKLVNSVQVGPSWSTRSKIGPSWSKIGLSWSKQTPFPSGSPSTTELSDTVQQCTAAGLADRPSCLVWSLDNSAYKNDQTSLLLHCRRPIHKSVNTLPTFKRQQNSIISLHFIVHYWNPHIN